MAESLNLSPKETPRDRNKALTEIITKSNQSISNILTDNDKDLKLVLSSGKSFSAHNRERMMYFSTKDEAEKMTQINLSKEMEGKHKPKQHHGNFKKYSFGRQDFIDEISKLPEGSLVNWTSMSKKYNLRDTNDKIPLNGGQILMAYAKSKGIDIHRFNKQKSVSGRDYLRRVRRAKTKLMKTRISIQIPRSAKILKSIVKKKIENKEINIGKRIAPKAFATTTITKEGQLEDKLSTIYGRKIPLEEIIERENIRLESAGVLRYRSDQEYEQMTTTDVVRRFEELNELTQSKEKDDLITILKSIERTRKIKVWHDHSSILNHTYVNFMISYLYDPANFLTNAEYAEKHPHQKRADVQKIVERPQLYILGQSGSSDEDKKTYVDTRNEDIATISKGFTYKNIVFQDRLRIFSGDNPARQFESGQQRGGNYSCLCGVSSASHINLECCFLHNEIDLEDRQKLFIQGFQWRKVLDGNLNPFQKLKKDDIIEELESRGIDTYGKDKGQLQDILNETLHGITRPPALMTDPSKTVNDLHINLYEVMKCEPLHDICNVVINVITELPYHLENQEAKVELEKFARQAVGEKNQLKGSDARKNAIKLLKCVQSLQNNSKIGCNVVNMISALVDTIHIAYSPDETRNPRQILRLYNATFIFGTLSKSIIANPVKMTKRKFYGNHFHSIVVHLPETYSIINTKSILAEDEERSFGTLRKISESTSNRKAGYVIDNAMIRFTSQQESDERIDSMAKQESEISKLSKLLSEQPRTRLTKEILVSKSSLVQAHFSRISPYLQAGENVWWHFDGGDVVFHDCIRDPPTRPEGPIPSHFRSTTLKQESNKRDVIWQNCISLVKSQNLILPLYKLKSRSDDGKLVTIYDKSAVDNTPATDNTITDMTDEASTPEVENETSNIMTEYHATQDEVVISQDEHVDADHSNHGNKDKEQNLEVKEMYKSYVKVVRWRERSQPIQSNSAITQPILQVSNKFAIDVTGQEEAREQRQNKQSTTKSNSLTNGAKKCKRKLFDQECSEGIASQKKPRTKIDLIINLIGNTEDVLGYQKYQGLLQKYPGNASFQKLMDISKAKMQNAISKRHNQLKAAIDNKTGNMSEVRLQKLQTEQLLDHWGYYHY